jgi:hypothetical protein
MHRKGLEGSSSNRRHLLVTLLRLEYMVLIIFVAVYSYLCLYNYELYFVIVFLFFSVLAQSR